MPVKLIKACKELNVGMSTVADFCQKLGYAISLDPSTRIDDDLYQILAEHFNASIANRIRGFQSVESIKFRNFRRFERFPNSDIESLKLGGVTYFVGGNNAGKSTVVKATLLVLDNLKNLQFEGDNSLLSIEVPFLFEGTGFHEVRVGDFDTAINANIRKDKNRRHEIIFEVTIDKFHFAIYVVNRANQRDEVSHVIVSKIEVTNIHDKASFMVDLMSRKVNFAGQTTLSEEQQESKTLVQNTITQLQAQLNEIKSKLEKTDIKAMDLAALHAQKDTISERLKLSQKQLANFADAKTFTKTREMNISNITTSNNALVKMVRGLSEDFNDKSGGSDDMRSQSIYVKEMSKDIESIVSSIAVEYIPAHMAYQKTFFTMADRDYMSQVISDYAHSRIADNSSEKRFILRWLGKTATDNGQKVGLNICKDFKLKPVAGEAYQVDVTTMDDSQTRLADLGMGSIQMFILLLRFATIMRKYSRSSNKPIIFVEEPELNLHPNWQSHLAELFRYLNGIGYQIVVETHSEYLIRKTQVLVANSGYEDQRAVDEACPFKVYYFSEDGCIDMRYRPDGKFGNSFGEGFFDEAANLAFEIM